MLENIKALCRERHVTLADVERACGLGKKSIYAWGTSAPSVERAKLVADYFGVTVDELLRHDANQDSRRTIRITGGDNR